MKTRIATSPDGNFVRSADAARAGGLRFGHVASTGSTNDDLAAAARSGETSPAVLVADHQTSGRGRLDRRWVDNPGRDLLVSFRLASRGHPHVITAAVAASLRAAAAAAVTEPVRFKWPNDLIVETGRRPGKLAGILAEYVTSDPPVVIVGCGLNMGRHAVVPSPVGATSPAGATSLAGVGMRGDPGGADDDRDAVLSATITGLLRRLEDPQPSLVELRSHSATLGRRVRVELPGVTALEGVAVDIDEEGRLMIRTAEGITEVGAGDVVHLRALGTAPDQDPPAPVSSKW